MCSSISHILYYTFWKKMREFFSTLDIQIEYSIFYILLCILNYAFYRIH